ncbi:MAG: methyltransferase domain-containing protein [Geobacteraceae bacterium]|jgi:trans-aconitate 2-methyltransferase
MPWDPGQYDKFQEERFAPFEELFALIKVREAMSVVDLGSGNGELTRRLAERLPGSSVLGIDNSPQMLVRAEEQRIPGLTFAMGEIAELCGQWDLVFSHAAIHWLDNHTLLIPRLMSHLRGDGQLALQQPSNHRHPSHTLIIETAGEEPFRAALAGWVRNSPVLEIDRYAELLHESGGREITVFEKVYTHILDDADSLAEWTSGTTLVPYFERLPHELHAGFLDRYREKLRKLWPQGPVFYTFRRIFLAATRGK